MRNAILSFFSVWLCFCSFLNLQSQASIQPALSWGRSLNGDGSLAMISGSKNILEDCDQIYALRNTTDPEPLLKAESCYRSWVSRVDDSQKLILLERAMINLSALVNSFPKQPAEKRAIALAGEWLRLYQPQIETQAEYKYWNAVWTSFECLVLDRGATLPRNLFRNLKTIQNQLRQAMELKPAIHFYGPHRVLGQMHSQMPGIVGGDKVLAERLFREAVAQAPSMSANWIGYANILYINGKMDEVKRVVRLFLSMTPESLEPFSGNPALSLKLETSIDLKKARELLAELE